VSRSSEDKLWWVSSKKGLFLVISFFYSLACTGSSRFPWRSVWRTQAPSRVAFFVCSAALGKILTLYNFKKRHVIVINRCYMHKKTGESMDHLLLHCDVASVLWSSLFGCFGMSWVMSRRVVDLLVCWWSSGRPRSTTVWKMTSICLFWCLWRERNNRSFEDLKSTLEEILSSFYLTLTFGLQLMSILCLLILLLYHSLFSF
jgi:hypothetical protein